MSPLLPLEDAVAKIDARTPIGSLLRSADWERVPTALRERAQFSAGVTSARVLQTIQDRLSDQLSLQRERLANGQSATFDRSSFIDAVRELAREEGLTPADPQERGTLRDITSIPRLGLIYDTQNQMATGYARWKLDQSEGALLLYPAWEFTRVEDRRVPREEMNPGFWDRRWVAAAQAAGDAQAVRVFRDTGRKVALKTSGIWSKLSRFGTPWMPFDWGSGMGTEDVDRDDAIALGLLQPDEIPAPTGEQDFNQELEASARDLAPEFRSVLSEHFGDQIDIAGDSIRWRAVRRREPETDELRIPEKPTAPPRESHLIAREGTAKTLHLPPAPKLPFTGPAVSRSESAEEALRRLNSGFRVRSQTGHQVAFGKILHNHLQRSTDVLRARFLPAAQATVENPVELWESNHRHYYIGRFKKKDGSLGFIVVAARTGETSDEVITIFPKTDREIEKFRKGKLLYSMKAVS